MPQKRKGAGNGLGGGALRDGAYSTQDAAANPADFACQNFSQVRARNGTVRIKLEDTDAHARARPAVLHCAFLHLGSCVLAQTRLIRQTALVHPPSVAAGQAGGTGKPTGSRKRLECKGERLRTRNFAHASCSAALLLAIPGEPPWGSKA